MPAPETEAGLPQWADELRRRYLRGEASQFVLHGNVHDLVLHQGELRSVSDFLSQVLLDRSKDTIIVYNISTGVRVAKRQAPLDGLDELAATRDPARVLPALERALIASDRLAVVLEYAETIAPASETSFSTVDDRAAAVTLHRWSLLRSLEHHDSIVILSLENLADLNARLVSNPRIATVRVPMPGPAERAALLAHLQPAMPADDVARLTEVTAGLKAIQIRAILAPVEPAAATDAAERQRYLVDLLSSGAAPTAQVRERAAKLAALTRDLSREQIRQLIAPEGKVAPSVDERAEIDLLVAARKREIIERECFGLIEFVKPQHGFEVVGGMEEVKKELLAIADNIRAGRRSRCPMGLLFTGPMGTGKTFVAEAFAGACGLTTIKLKNFRSKWVGATEGNLEKILGVLQAIGQVIVIIDEGDRAFGGGEGGETDGGTSSRVIGRIKEFMSDTSNRGRVLFIVMTNRPDKLDVDLKRAGRLDRKIPFLYPQSTAEVSRVVQAQLRKNTISADLEFPRDEGLLAGMVGLSNADIEAVLLSAADLAAARGAEERVGPGELAQAVADYLPSSDQEMLSYMELLAVFEASNRRMLPRKYADIPVEQLQDRLRLLRAQVGARR